MPILRLTYALQSILPAYDRRNTKILLVLKGMILYLFSVAQEILVDETPRFEYCV